MNRILLSPDEPQGGGAPTSQSGNTTATELFGGGQQQQPQTTQQTAQQTPASGDNDQPTHTPTPQQAAMGITPDMLAEAFKKAGVGAPPAAQQEPQMTEEEFKQRFQVFDANDELLAGLSHEDPAARKAAYNQMAKMMVRNSIAIAQHLMQQELGKLTQQFNPALEYAREAQMKKMEDQFFSKYPDLKGHHSLVNMAATQLQASGFKGTLDQAFEQVAASVKNVLKTLPGVNGQQQQQQQTTATSRMSTVLTGGQGGAGGQPQGGQQSGGRNVNPLAKTLFGSRK